MEPKEALGSVRDTLSARQVFGEPVERDGVTVIPAATVIGTGGGGGGSKSSGDGDEPVTGAGMGVGLFAWPSGAFEIREDRVTWRPTLDFTRILLAALGVVTALGLGGLAALHRGR